MTLCASISLTWQELNNGVHTIYEQHHTVAPDGRFVYVELEFSWTFVVQERIIQTDCLTWPVYKATHKKKQIYGQQLAFFAKFQANNRINALLETKLASIFACNYDIRQWYWIYRWAKYKMRLLFDGFCGWCFSQSWWIESDVGLPSNWSILVQRVIFFMKWLILNSMLKVRSLTF